MHRRTAVAGVLAALFTVLGCSDDPQPSTAEVRDSAGIAIVAPIGPQLDTTRGWRLSDSPVVQIGAEDDASGTALFRVNAVARLSDGRIVAVDGGDQELRFFSPTGEFLKAVGGKGGGPGEFQMIFGMRALPGDTLLVHDWQARRFTLFDATGEVVATSGIQAEHAELMVGRLADGSNLIQGGRNPMYLDMGNGRKWSSGWVARLDADGQEAARLIEFNGSESIVADGVGGVASMGAPYYRSNTPLLAGDQLVLAGNERYELRYHSLDGTLRRIVRPAYEVRQVSAADISGYRERYIENSGFEPERARALADIMEFPETYPAFADARADRLGHVWVRAYRPRGTTGPESWSVFGPEGEWVTEVSTPEDFRVLEIGADHILGVVRDDLGVEYVRMYSLIKDADRGA